MRLILEAGKKHGFLLARIDYQTDVVLLTGGELTGRQDSESSGSRRLNLIEAKDSENSGSRRLNLIEAKVIYLNEY